MRRASKVDDNQLQIVKGLRSCGATVQPIHAIGKGCPDILVGTHGKNYLFEIKRDAKSTLTHDEKLWSIAWRGQYAIIHSVEEALKIINNKKQKREP
jgi:Holliday junction resolvase